MRMLKKWKVPEAELSVRFILDHVSRVTESGDKVCEEMDGVFVDKWVEIIVVRRRNAWVGNHSICISLSPTVIH